MSTCGGGGHFDPEMGPVTNKMKLFVSLSAQPAVWAKALGMSQPQDTSGLGFNTRPKC